MSDKIKEIVVNTRSYDPKITFTISTYTEVIEFGEATGNCNAYRIVTKKAIHFVPFSEVIHLTLEMESKC